LKVSICQVLGPSNLASVRAWGLVILTTLQYNHGRHARRPPMHPHPGAHEEGSHCEGKEASAMRHIPNDDRPSFVAQEPEQCSACYWIIA
jgi:hypothetical protein